MRWRLLRDGASNPTTNLAVEEAIVRSRREGLCPDTLRLWRNDRSVILGCNSSPHDEVDVEACRRIGVPILRRTSGGGAVYHDLGNINYSVVMKEQRMTPNEHILTVYERFADAILAGLGHLNVEAEFRHPNTIFLNGRKISGMAQHRFYDVILFHGTLLVDSDLQALSRTLLHLKHEVTNISREVAGPISTRLVEDAIVAGFQESFGILFNAGRLNSYESRMSQELLSMKYGTEKWNLHIDGELTAESISNLPIIERLAAHEDGSSRARHPTGQDL